MPDDTRTSIEESAEAPKRIRGDEGEFEEHSLPDQMAADRYIDSKNAVDNRTRRGIRISRLQPPGTTNGPAD